jgi:hypothetical protein
VSQLSRPISAGLGIAWLATAVLVVATGLLLARSIDDPLDEMRMTTVR